MALIAGLNVASPEAGLARTPLVTPDGRGAWSWLQWFLSVYRVLSLIKVGSGDPNSKVTASPPSIYLNVSGGAGTTLYVKE